MPEPFKRGSNTTCCVYGCKSIHKNTRNLSFHRFPNPKQLIKVENDFGELNEQNRRKLWEISLKIGKEITEHMRVCSLHFKKEDYHLEGWNVRKTLSPNAYPSQNLPLSNLIQKRKDEGRDCLKEILFTQPSSLPSDEIQENIINLIEENETTNEATEPLLQVKVSTNLIKESSENLHEKVKTYTHISMNPESECRACLEKTDSCQSIFTKNIGFGELNKSFAEIIMFSSDSIYITPNDGLPDVICSHCAEKLSEFYHFILQISKNDNILRSRVTDVSVLKVEDVLMEDFNEDHFQEDLVDNCHNTLNQEILHNDPLSLEEIVEEDSHMKMIEIENKPEGSDYHESETIFEDCHIGIKEEVLNIDPLNYEAVKIKTEEVCEENKLQDDLLIEKTDEKKFECDQCEKKFAKLDYLNKHSLIHSKKKLLKCKQCNKRFLYKCSLRKHSFVHTVEKPFECEFCSKKFTLKHQLTVHLLNHAGEKQFKCEKCNLKFSFKCNLTSHLMTHRTEKNFKCKQCNKNFALKRYLNEHLLTHEDEKVFECENCNKKFGKKVYLKNHLKIHQDKKAFECDMCNKKFLRKQHLVDHILIHTGEKNFKCELCNKMFLKNSYLKEHLKLHSVNKPFECETCSKKFTNKSNLNTHLKIHSGEKGQAP